jgi:hypothetical protein
LRADADIFPLLVATERGAKVIERLCFLNLRKQLSKMLSDRLPGDLDLTEEKLGPVLTLANQGVTEIAAATDKADQGGQMGGRDFVQRLNTTLFQESKKMVARERGRRAFSKQPFDLLSLCSGRKKFGKADHGFIPKKNLSRKPY